MSTAGQFRRSGSYDMPGAPIILRQAIQRLCFQHGISTVEAEIAEIRRQFLAEESVPGPPEVERPIAGNPAGHISKRSESMRRSWALRHAIRDYMTLNPDVSEEEATRIVKERQEHEPRTRVVGDEVDESKDRRGSWATRIENKITEAAQAGETIDWEEGERRVRESMRNRRRANKEAREAAQTDNPAPQGEGDQVAA